MTVPQCGMGRGLTTDEWAGTDTLSELEAWLAQRLFTGTSHRHGDGPTPAAAADAVPTQTVGPGPCGPVAAGCYGASAAELELEGVLLVLLDKNCLLHKKCLSMKCRYLHVSADIVSVSSCICWYHVSICMYV